MTGMIGCLDLFFGFLMLWAMLRITTAANLRTTQGRWALFRRIVYGSTSIAIFGLGISRLDGHHPITSVGEFIFQIMLLFGVAIFPLLRAFNWITQDQFKAVDGTSDRSPTRGR